MSNVKKSAKIIQELAPDFKPKIAIVLGSGLGRVAKLVNPVAEIPYSKLPGFPEPRVEGHEGRMILGDLHEVPVIFLRGRQHYYEGEGFEGTRTMIRTLKEMGVESLFLTNAAGSLRSQFNVGGLVAIKDHIMLSGLNPLIGANDDEYGPRFLGQAEAWDKALRKQLLKQAGDAGVSEIGEGVYFYMTGPTFETPSEVNAIRVLGGDTVGMSTVIENIIARHCGLRCVGVSAVTNLAEGLSDEPLSHDHTLKGAQKAQDNMIKAISAFVKSLG